MSTYDLRDEAVVAATPEEVTRALADEAAGRSHWWQPWFRLRVRGEGSFDEVGTLVDMAASPNGHVDRGLGTTHMSGRVTSVTPQRRIEVEYAEGDLAGTVVWTLDPVDDGHARVATRWTEDPHSAAMRLLHRFLHLEEGHSRVMREGFCGLEAYAVARRTGRDPA